MNKEGFTLIEILAVFALISLLLLIAIPSISFAVKRINARLLDTKKEMILSAAELYAGDTQNLSYVNDITYIEIDTLIKNEYIESDGKGKYNEGDTPKECILNPSKKEYCIKGPIKVRKKKKSYVASFDNENNPTNPEIGDGDLIIKLYIDDKLQSSNTLFPTNKNYNITKSKCNNGNIVYNTGTKKINVTGMKQVPVTCEVYFN